MSEWQKYSLQTIKTNLDHSSYKKTAFNMDPFHFSMKILLAE